MVLLQSSNEVITWPAAANSIMMNASQMYCHSAHAHAGLHAFSSLIGCRGLCVKVMIHAWQTKASIGGCSACYQYVSELIAHFRLNCKSQSVALVQCGMRLYALARVQVVACGHEGSSLGSRFILRAEQWLSWKECSTSFLSVMLVGGVGPPCRERENTSTFRA